jgi:DNA-binding MurR/RpiR family transcriptional regulator
MDNSNIFSRIQRRNKTFSHNQKRIARYILNNTSEVAFLTALKLGQKLDISESTVIRFAISIGYDGFAEMQKDLQGLVKDKLIQVSEIKKYTESVKNGDNIIDNVLNSDIENIRDTLNNVSHESFNRLIDELINAHDIYIVGLRSMGSLAYIMGISLQIFLNNVMVVSYGISGLAERLINIGKGDLLVGISFPIYTLRTIEIMEFAKEKGVTIGAITDSIISPLSNVADISLTTTTKLNPFTESFTAPLSLINAIITAVGIRKKKKALKSLSELEYVLRKLKICSM